MTLGDLRRSLALYLGLDSTTSDGLVGYWDADLLNKAAREIANELAIPRGSVEFTKADLQGGPVSLPSDVITVLRVVVPPDLVVPVLDADDYVPDDDGVLMPRVKLMSGYAFLLNADASPQTLRFVGPSWEEPPDRIKVVYMKSFNDMVNETDVPWGGAYPRYHELIALRAAMTALLNLDPGEPETAMRYRRVLDIYQSLYDNFASDVDPVMYLGGGSLRRLMYGRMRL